MRAVPPLRGKAAGLNANEGDSLGAVVESVLSDTGPIARALPGFEPRGGQRRMAAAVASVLDRGGTLLAEAGTGTGKTLAYLVPAILSRQRVLVSTGTKNLQEQIFYKDLPALQEALGVPFTATLMKGRGNYLCLHKLQTIEAHESNESSGLFGSFPLESFEPPERERSERAVFLPIVQEWARSTTTGDRAELRDLPENLPLWRQLSAEADTCLGVECPRFGDCFLTLMRQRAAESDVVIVNHHLLCADASVRRGSYGEVIPACATLVIDEAHQLEDVATQYFGVSVSNYRVDELVRDAVRMLAAAGSGAAQAAGLMRALDRVSHRSSAFFAAVSAGGTGAGAYDGRFRYTAENLSTCVEEGLMLVGALEGLEASLAAGIPGGNAETADGISVVDPDIAASVQRRAGALRNDLRLLLRADDSDYVFYLERRGRGIFLRASPVDVSRILPDALLDRFRAIVLTSATLAVDGSFAYARGRLGIGGAAELRVSSEFDYERQALLYLPRKMPPPKSPAFAAAVAREAIELLTRSRGRAFVLFTSYRILGAVQRLLEMALPYPILVQGSAPRSALIDQFRRTPNAVLLATSSFWQGVDVAGESLSCVVIDKLPFASPGDPVTSARIEAINARGGDAFSEYQVPLAILSLQQGLGRLIRHRQDRGVLAILDPRLGTMGYGRRFLASLPPAPVTRDLDAVERFFK